jgi:8-oxo-dGTP pyrophosphatase MutT (NUDIX family)
VFDDQPELRDAVVVIIHDGDELLFIERAPGDTYPGYWSVVTGSLEPGEDQAAACVREAMEEVGLIIRPVRKVWESVTRGAHFVLHWWMCELAGPREVRPDASEVSDWKWLRTDRLGSLPLMFGDSRWFYREIYPRVTGRDEG